MLIYCWHPYPCSHHRNAAHFQSVLIGTSLCGRCPSGKLVAKTIITTDTFVKIGDQWKVAAAHSSAVAYP
jgi:hypothetical protein